MIERMTVDVPPDIFKAYDIRGIYGEEIDGDLAERIGRGFAEVLSGLAGKPASELRVGLGRDMRLSAPELSARYREGLSGAGAHVIDAGQVATEMLYFLVGSRELDGGNGMAGPMVGPLLERLGLDLEESYWTPDGNFPDHEPNPLLPENRRLIIEHVKAAGADLGIAWDGDADRCFFIDETGSFVDGDFLTALLAESLLGKAPAPANGGSGSREAVLYDVRASWAVPDTVRRAGGIPYVNRVGHAFFKTRMRAEGSLFGGEVSGHYYFRDFYCADSGTIPALLVLELLALGDRSMAQLLAPYRERYFISGEINSEVADPIAKMEEIAERFSDSSQERIDGVSINYEDWHFNVRPSNTEPLLRLCLESLLSREDMEHRRDEVLALIRS